MVTKDNIYIEVGEVGEVNGIKVRAVVDEYEPHMSCRHCCFNSPSLVNNCFNVNCQKSLREDGVGVVFEFAD